jgi:hypothetical protein
MSVPVKKLSPARCTAGVLLALCLCVSAAAAHAVVVTFDDLSLSPNDPIPDGYGGINWTTSPFIDFLWFEGASVDPLHPPPSAPAVAYPRNGFDGGPVSFHFLSPAVFDGSYVYAIADSCAGTCVNPVPQTVKFDLYLGGVLQHESATLIGNSDWQFLASGYSGLVDEVKVTRSLTQYTAFIDNLTYSNPVPEPQALVLLTIGLIGTGLLTRRRRMDR